MLKEWDVPITKATAIVTDNASNMLKAFRQHFQESVEDEGDEEGDESDEGSELLSDSESDLDDFGQKELEHDIAFSGFIKRVSYFSHTLQLIVHKFNEDTTFCSVLPMLMHW